MLTTKKRAHPFTASLLCAGMLLWAGGCTPPGPRALLKGEQSLKAGNYPEAISRFTEASQLMATNAVVWNRLGLAYHYSGQPAKAIQSYQQALVRDRNLADALFNLGTLYLEQGNYSAAADTFTTYVSLRKSPDLEGWLKLGQAQFHQASQLTGAERNRYLDASRRNLEFSLSLGRTAETFNLLGLIQLQRNHPREALAQFQAALKVQPNYPAAILNQAVVFQQHFNDPRVALQFYRHFLSLQPRPARAAEVESYLRHLEAQLAAAARPPSPTAPGPAVTNTPTAAPLSLTPTNRPGLTNAVLTATNPPARTGLTLPPPTLAQRIPALAPAPTNAVATTNAAKIENPKPSSLIPAKPNNAVPVKPTSPPQRPTAEVISLPQEVMPIKPASELSSTTAPLSNAPAPATIATSATIAVTAPPITNEVTLTNPPSEPVNPSLLAIATTPTQTSGSQGLLKKLNPAGWFKRDKSSRQIIATPLSWNVVTSQVVVATNPAPTPASAPDPLLVIGPTPIRYTYRHPAKPQPGKRSEASSFFLTGLAAQRQQQWTEAAVAYRAALQRDPAFFEAAFNLGLVESERGQLMSALEHLETALVLQPRSPEALQTFGATLLLANAPQDAANEWEKLVELQPQESGTHLSLAHLYAQDLGRPALARKHYLALLAKEPRHPNADQIRSWLAQNP